MITYTTDCKHQVALVAVGKKNIEIWTTVSHAVPLPERIHIARCTECDKTNVGAERDA
jgi:hypothetical protein